MAYTRPPTEEELKGTGLVPADFDEEAEIWPENWEAWSIFRILDTQWNFGINGRTGLRYEVLFDLLDRRGYAGQEWEDMVADVRVLEDAALTALNKSK